MQRSALRHVGLWVWDAWKLKWLLLLLLLLLLSEGLCLHGGTL